MINIPISNAERRLNFSIAIHGRRDWLDPWMIKVSDPYSWLTPVLILIMILIYGDWYTTILMLIVGSLGAGLSDFINTRLIKPRVSRIRPGKFYDEIQSLGIMNRGRKSFPSNHASNTMAFAWSLGLYFPPLGWVAMVFAFLVGYSRIYCGAHHPLDVAVGFIHSTLWTLLIFRVVSSFIQ